MSSENFSAPRNDFPFEYPGARHYIKLWSHGKGNIAAGRPMGVVVHYTADRNLTSVYKSLEIQGLGYHLIIDRDGSIDQWCSLLEKVWHAGDSEWRGYRPNHSFLGICLVSFGQVTPSGNHFKTWFGREILEDEAEKSEIRVTESGFWDAASPAQEVSLLYILQWLVLLGIDPRNICGHDECCIPHGRKVDPGGVLSMTMPELREKLRTLHN